MTGPLTGVRVVEVASEHAAFAGKLLADLGADVVVVEPPGGHLTRTYGPFVDDREDPETSLWWWNYNTSKRSVVLDLEAPGDGARFSALVDTADIVLEAEPPDRLGSLGIDHSQCRAARPELIWVSVTPFGRADPRSREPVTDLTILAGGGLVWSSGYDDHTIPPVRAGGNQACHMAGTFAAMSALTAYLHLLAGGPGQHVDVSMHAAANVTPETGSVFWLVAGQTVQRQTGRHAMPQVSMEVQVLAPDGRYITTGFGPNTDKDFQVLLDWMDELGLRDEFPEAFFLEMGIERGGVRLSGDSDDVEGLAILGAAREALRFIATRIPAYDFFVGSQDRDLQCGIVYSPEEAFEDVHFRERGFGVEVDHEDLGRRIAYPGPPFGPREGTWRVARRPPHVGEHNAEILAGD